LAFVLISFSQVLQTREDGVIIVKRADGSRIVEYLDGTRVTKATNTHVKHVVNQETGESNSVEIEYTDVTVSTQATFYVRFSRLTSRIN